MTKAKQERLLVIGKVDRGELTVAQAAEALRRSVRQVRRIFAAYWRESAAALAHGDRGRTPTHTISDDVRRQVMAPARTRYAELNDTLLTEKLTEPEGSRSPTPRCAEFGGMPDSRPRANAGRRHTPFWIRWMSRRARTSPSSSRSGCVDSRSGTCTHIHPHSPAPDHPWRQRYEHEGDKVTDQFG